MSCTRSVMSAIYRHFSETGRRPEFSRLVAEVGDAQRVRQALATLAADHIVVLDDDDQDVIEMALPFSGVPRPHDVTVAGLDYAANCAWDAFGIVAALAGARNESPHGRIQSRCADCDDPIAVAIEDGKVHGDAVVHFVVPAHQWWDDIRFT